MDKPFVLLVEDQVDQQEVYTVMLKLQGFEVMSANNGKEALEKLHAHRPDLILTDISMPIMDGLELIKRVRDESEFDTVPIIVMTSFQKAYLSWGWALGANETIKKPFAPDELYGIIRKVLPSTHS